MRKIVIIGLIVLLLALSFGCAAPTKPAATAAPVLVITPASGKAGVAIAIYGAGFVPGENITVEVPMGGVSVGLGAKLKWANESGAFKDTSNIPIASIAKPGLYTVEAIGNKGSVAVCPLEVVA